ncbi:helix-turn-helix domain-containing protein [Gordonia sp. ABSL1-1]|uniref:TetR/AcrR family transcriptional regulator n=1 Tax=Gordonia sp. ABSL1-1 TaxID=3053923 RepID=UPI0025723126|nr:TetR/AcrR family transcriptional regulator [Gordonia sp. ABSL1-1]MDL9936595.1 helix-turn-helix domain-containing protein [Gordonia sp. ABSL1-1]
MPIRNEEIGDLVLDAARRCLIRGNGAKVTVSEVAREAGFSRPTVYRRWPDINEIFRALLTREVLGTVERTTGMSDRGVVVIDDLPQIVVHCVAALRENELMQVLWTGRREFMAPYVFDRLGTSQQGVLAVLADLIAQAQEHGRARAGDAKKQAAMVMLIAQSFLQSGVLFDDILADDWKAELYRLLVGYLRPGAGDRLA